MKEFLLFSLVEEVHDEVHISVNLIFQHSVLFSVELSVWPYKDECRSQ